MEPISLDTLKRIAQLAGFEWNDAELAPIAPAVARALESFRQLDTLPLGDVEPSTQYRVL